MCVLIFFMLTLRFLGEINFTNLEFNCEVTKILVLQNKKLFDGTT